MLLITPMDLQTFYLRMRQEVSEYVVSGREETAAFLIWFIENYFRQESQDAVDSVCDHKNDKGIDGILVDDEEGVIYLFQSKYSPVNEQSQGDNDIRNFIGAREWFETGDSVQQLLDSNASSELKSLVEQKNIIEKTHYKLVSVFVTNKHFNTHANEFIGVTQKLEGYDDQALFQKYTYFSDEKITAPPIDIFLANQTKIEYNLPDDTIARVYAIKAKELVKLNGIQDRTLFYKDVRYGVGKTRVNKSIENTILNRNEHNNFFLYHNGITIICGTLNEDLTHNKINIRDYMVINGCQSILTFYENRNKLSDDLHIPVKIIELSITSPLVDRITYYANNQNSISLKDLRSNDSVQKSLQREFEKIFGNDVFYNRKRGEALEGYDEVIDKDLAAQLIEAVYRSSPHNTHLKQKLFGEEYFKIFSRQMNAEKIYLSYLLYKTINDNTNLLGNEKIRKYGLSIFFFAHTLAEIMREEELGRQILGNPRDYITTNKTTFMNTIKKVWDLVTPDINADIEEYTEANDDFFDYKNVFKNSQFVKTMSRKIKSDYIRITRRKQEDSFTNIYNNFLTSS